MKVQTEPSTPKDQLSRKPTSSPPKKKPRMQIMVMEGGDKDMEVHIITHQDDESILMKSN
jgi:hypothetical protein